MCLDNRLIHDIKEAASNNSMLTLWMPNKIKVTQEDGTEIEVDNPEKYSFGTPRKVQSALQRTIASGVPTAKRIRHDFYAVFDVAIPAVLAANGTYIDDDTGGGRHGHRAARKTAFIKDRDIGPNQDSVQKFAAFVDRLKAGQGVGNMKLEGGAAAVVEEEGHELMVAFPADADGGVEEEAGADVAAI